MEMVKIHTYNQENKTFTETGIRDPVEANVIYLVINCYILLKLLLQDNVLDRIRLLRVKV